MLYQDRFNSELKITFNGDEYTCSRRKIFKERKTDWEQINFGEIRKGNKVKLQDPDGSLVTHQDGRTEYVALSDVYVDELGLLCFNI